MEASMASRRPAAWAHSVRRAPAQTASILLDFLVMTGRTTPCVGFRFNRLFTGEIAALRLCDSAYCVCPIFTVATLVKAIREKQPCVGRGELACGIVGPDHYYTCRDAQPDTPHRPVAEQLVTSKMHAGTVELGGT